MGKELSYGCYSRAYESVDVGSVSVGSLSLSAVPVEQL
jgi:hypothetical protein